MSEKEKIYIFDDGSIASRLLQHELKDKYEIKAVGVNVSDTVVEWFSKISPDRKVHLHCTYEQLSADHEQLRRDIKKAESLGFTNLIFLDYEGLDEKTLKYRAQDAGISDIKLTGKPEAIAIDVPDEKPYIEVPGKVDPDDEMKGLDSRDNFIARRKDEEDKSIKSKFRKKFVSGL